MDAARTSLPSAKRRAVVEHRERQWQRIVGLADREALVAPGEQALGAVGECLSVQSRQHLRRAKAPARPSDQKHAADRMAPVDAWLTAARDALADVAGLPAEELELDEATAVTLLDLARIAARGSGDRTNAPLLSYLLGRASREADLEALAAAVRRLA